MELAAKALLRAASVEYPRRHDVSDALLEAAPRLPGRVRGRVRELADLVSELAAVRGPAMYGYEDRGIPASRAFSNSYADEVLARTTTAVRTIEEVLVPRLRDAGCWP